MKKNILLATLLITLCMIITPAFAKSTVTALTCEYKTNPIGIDVANPRLSWEIASKDRDITQSAWQLQIATATKTFKDNIIWDSGKVPSGQSVLVDYRGPVLQSGTRYYWRVRVWDTNDKSTSWSDQAFWEMGLLNTKDWQAEWIQPEMQQDLTISNPSPLLRKNFQLEKQVKSARAYISSLGLYELHINGARVGDQVLTPGWTSYHKRLQYQTYDITDMLNKGANAVGAILGDGWYRGNLAWDGNRNLYGENLALIMQINVEFQDGSKETITTDGSWKCSTSPILKSDIYNGEAYDARKEISGWAQADLDDSNWVGVKQIDHSKSILIAPEGPPVKRVHELKPIEKIVTPEGDTVFDLGQNMVGWIRFTVQGPAGSKVKIRHAEVLDKDGNFYTENLRTADQLVEYTLKGEGVETYEPHFTFQGFRYISVDEWPGEPTVENFTGVVVLSDIGTAGDFECSDPLLNQLQHNIQWGQKGNFVDVPTDCPQRDERLGWTGDAQAFAPTACFNADVASFYTKWMGDFIADQKTNGAIPNVIPDALSLANPNEGGGACGWADAVVIVPWTVYLSYGDIRILEKQYDSMKKWVEFMHGRAGDDYIWTGDYHFGDWLSYNRPISDAGYPGAYTDTDFLATAYYAYSTGLVAKIASILGENDDAKTYSTRYEKIKKAFNKEFLTSNGRLSPNTQTAYSIALKYNLVPKGLDKAAAKRLADDVNHFGHITTGFLGTPLISSVLSEYGYWDEAYMLLNRKDYPSWLYPVTKGATTIWERWDGIKPDGSFQSKGMNSFNHYAYGAIGNWMYSEIAGIQIDPEKPGYKHIIIAPHPGGGLTFAKAWHQTMYGVVKSSWEIKNNNMIVSIQIPSNTTATVILPNAKSENIKESGKSLAKAKGIHIAEQINNKIKISLGSGEYEFTYPIQK